MKIRQWLIHKLGGYTKNDVSKIDVSSIYPTIVFKRQKLYSQYETFNFQRTKEFENSVKMHLCEQLSKQLFNYVKFDNLYKPVTNSMVYSVEIDVLYDKKGEDNESI